MTPTSPTWGDVEAFLNADGWRRLAGSLRGGKRQRHIFFEKLLDDGSLLTTHISHDRGAHVSAGRFGSILREQLEVSRDDFWQAVRSGEPVKRPAVVEAPERPEHEGWVIRVLVDELHMGPAEIGALGIEDAKRKVFDHWSKPSSS